MSYFNFVNCAAISLIVMDLLWPNHMACGDQRALFG
ncbi:hypothetical protein SLEP1_g45956 [Rubroshorea leprosula]|uniref:Uncharacterized protein n=1 Tax=Rubroshorea leprosula TaxID=152421 RepID=A0AAV5LMF1_9ROSI|nr:hypothetical protein SLEP1_g45956 [Rubroshorea leprosula]